MNVFYCVTKRIAFNSVLFNSEKLRIYMSSSSLHVIKLEYIK